ncbi:MAG: type I phosphomannose isomerase catalytic subunit [Phycisphaerae bacterium]
MDVYPCKFEPLYKPKIWGGRNLARLFGRELPGEEPIGESWELADIDEGTTTVANGPEAGTTLTELTRKWSDELLGGASLSEAGRFPLLLKLLDAEDTLSLQVHPDADAVRRLGGALKTECWYVVESGGGFIYKGVREGVTAEQFRQAVESNTVDQVVRRVDVSAGDFHYLPAGTVHALGAGVVVAEVQTPSDTTFRVSDWGRGREIHVEESLQCIHFEPTEDTAPGAAGETLLETEYFTVARRGDAAGAARALPERRCAAIMLLTGEVKIRCQSGPDRLVTLKAGDTALVPAGVQGGDVVVERSARWLEITLPES